MCSPVKLKWEDILGRRGNRNHVYQVFRGWFPPLETDERVQQGSCSCCIGKRLRAEEKENERWPDAASGSFCHFRRCRSPSFPCCSLWALLNIYNQQEYIQSPRIYTITKNIQSPSIYNHQEYIQSPTGVKKITNGRTKNLPEHKPNQKRKSK